MACLTFFTSFFVSVFKASKTLKLMTVTHFQRFFRCPGAPKKEPKGQPDFIFCVSFFDLGPNGVQGASRRCPREPKRSPGGPKRGPREAKGDPKGVQGNQKGAQGEPRGAQKGAPEAPRVPKRVLGSVQGTVAGRPQAIGYIYIYICYTYIDMFLYVRPPIRG